MNEILFKPGVRRAPPVVAIPTPEHKAFLEENAKKPKKEKEPVYNLTWNQITEMKKQAAKEAVMDLAQLTLGLPVMYMRDKEGWGKVRLDRMIDGLLSLMDSYEKGYISLDDVRTALWEEVGVRIEKKTVWRTTK